STSVPSATPTPGPPYSVLIDDDVTPSLLHQEIAVRALAQIASAEARLGRRIAEPQILTVRATRLDRVSSSARDGQTGEGSQAVWYVTARGTFVPFFGPPDISADNGYWLFDDAGNVISSGFPIRDNVP
ncbi:MAG TPA: hypothetical protein VH741_01780, partial [Candidatus Limnocylindrales bacterium]